jgi:phenylacetate-CoA ligase
MSDESVRLALEAFRRATKRVPAYRVLLDEAGVRPEDVQTLRDFSQLPVLEKATTFQRFDLTQLCVDGDLGRLGAVLTSSGHSGNFAFGLTESDALPRAAAWIDNILDSLFHVRTRPTLLINCLPMGVKVATQACTLAETSVRADMVTALVRAFARHFHQIIMVGETAFIKHVLELGQRTGINWPDLRIHVIVGEEPLAENARKYLERILRLDLSRPEGGVVFSSMGVAEVGLNLFSEAPPLAPLIVLRRALHDDRALREAVLGRSDWVPSLFTFDPQRLFVEFDARQRLIVTTLDASLRLPLIRYATGDRGAFLQWPAHLRTQLEATGVSWHLIESLPIVLVHGRGDHAIAGTEAVYPEAVKEGIYHEPQLAALITANFRLVSGPEHVRIRLQLSPDVKADAAIAERFRTAISHYVSAPFVVSCEAYEDFGSGMSLDYERKFQYLATDPPAPRQN